MQHDIQVGPADIHPPANLFGGIALHDQIQGPGMLRLKAGKLLETGSQAVTQMHLILTRFGHP